MRGNVSGEIADIFVVLVRDYDHVTGIIFDPKRIDKGGHSLVYINYILEPEQCPLVLYPVYSEADGTDVVRVSVVVHKDYWIIIHVHENESNYI